MVSPSSPWKLLESTGGYIFTWLIGYSALLGPIAGILIADYFLVRKTELNVDDLFKRNGQYTFNDGWNPIGVMALVISVLPNIPGFLKEAGFVENVPSIFSTIYSQAWFVGAILSVLIYTPLMKAKLKQITKMRPNT